MVVFSTEETKEAAVKSNVLECGAKHTIAVGVDDVEIVKTRIIRGVRTTRWNKCLETGRSRYI